MAMAMAARKVFQSACRATGGGLTRRMAVLGRRGLSTEAAGPLTTLSEEETMFKDTGADARLAWQWWRERRLLT